jgi:hypothetical protein
VTVEVSGRNSLSVNVGQSISSPNTSCSHLTHGCTHSHHLGHDAHHAHVCDRIPPRITRASRQSSAQDYGAHNAQDRRRKILPSKIRFYGVVSLTFGAVGNVADNQNLNVMSTYTPTHCPETGRKFTKAERSIANKAKYAAERKASKPKATKSAPKRKPKASKVALKTKTVKRPKRSSAAGLEQAQARTSTANKVGDVVKTKVVHAVTEGEAVVFEPRKEIVVPPSVAKRKAVKEVFTLLDGETPQEAIRRQRILAERERCALEAEALMSGAPDADSSPF